MVDFSVTGCEKIGERAAEGTHQKPYSWPPPPCYGVPTNFQFGAKPWRPQAFTGMDPNPNRPSKLLWVYMYLLSSWFLSIHCFYCGSTCTARRFIGLSCVSKLGLHTKTPSVTQLDKGWVQQKSKRVRMFCAVAPTLMADTFQGDHEHDYSRAVSPGVRRVVF